MKYNYTKKKFSIWSIIVKFFKVVCAFFKLIFFILSIPYKIYKGIEDIISAIKAKPQKA